MDSAGATSYDYDALCRLTQASYPNGDVISYGYDAVGNRTSLTINGNPITNTYNAANELTASGSDTYTHAVNGNLTSKTVNGVTTSYTWDPTGIGHVIANGRVHLGRLRRAAEPHHERLCDHLCPSQRGPLPA